jgi:hypothetical protein
VFILVLHVTCKKIRFSVAKIRKSGPFRHRQDILKNKIKNEHSHISWFCISQLMCEFKYFLELDESESNFKKKMPPVKGMVVPTFSAVIMP